MSMYDDLEKILITKEQLRQRIEELGKQLDKDYQGKEPIMICVLNGSVIFYSDLVRAMKEPVRLSFITLSSYGDGTETMGTVKVVSDLRVDIAGKDVVIVEDIVDSGITLTNLVKMLNERHPASVKIITLLDKYKNRRVPFEPDYYGFKIENEFVVGYGLDYAQKYRNLPEVGVLKH